MNVPIHFAFDPKKSAANLRKHKVSFDEAATFFYDPLRAIELDTQHSWDEERLITIGMSTQSRVLFIVYTETDSSVRLIGARVATATERAHDEEIA